MEKLLVQFPDSHLVALCESLTNLGRRNLVKDPVHGLIPPFSTVYAVEAIQYLKSAGLDWQSRCEEMMTEIPEESPSIVEFQKEFDRLQHVAGMQPGDEFEDD